MMPNEENLIPLNRRTKGERRKIATMGGIASGEARRARKTARQCAEIYLSLPVSDMRKWNKMSRDGVEPDDIDNMMLMVAAMAKAAQSGDVAAFNTLLKVLGEDKPVNTDDDETGVIVLGEVNGEADA
jgi:hypothetical protein